MLRVNSRCGGGLGLALAAAFAASLAGCASVRTARTEKQALQALEERAARVLTVRGRAWVSAKSPEGSVAFAVEIAVDRSDPGGGKLRLAALGPFGTTPSVLVLSGERLTWIDYERRTVTRIDRVWHGLPVSELPTLFLGLAPRSHAGSGSTVALEWDALDSEPRLSAVRGRVGGSRGASEEYVVRYSDFPDAREFGLPREIELQGGDRVSVRVSWREREWNEPIAAGAFETPRTDF